VSVGDEGLQSLSAWKGVTCRLWSSPSRWRVPPRAPPLDRGIVKRQFPAAIWRCGGWALALLCCRFGQRWLASAAGTVDGGAGVCWSLCGGFWRAKGPQLPPTLHLKPAAASIPHRCCTSSRQQVAIISQLPASTSFNWLPPASAIHHLFPESGNNGPALPTSAAGYALQPPASVSSALNC
jgi:hypothetical protein